MHEAKIASLILEKADKRLCQFSNIEEVRCIELVVGKFRNIDSESLSFAFDALKGEKKFFEKTILKIEEIDAIALCENNGHAYAIEFRSGFACPICGSGIGSLKSGQELEIRKIQLLSEGRNA